MPLNDLKTLSPQCQPGDKMSVQEAVFLQLLLVALSVAVLATVLPLTPIFMMKHQKSSTIQ